MSKALKYILIFIAGIILLIAALSILTQTSFFREKAKIKLISVLENQLNLNLEIEQIDGNIYNNLVFKNIRFTDNDSTTATFALVQLNYKLLPLTNKIINIDSVIIESPKINLWQKKDSTWNLGSYLVPKVQTSKKDSLPFNYNIIANFLAINNGAISISSFSMVIPQKIRDFNLTANGYFKDKRTRVHLEKFNFNTENPSLVLKNLSGIYNMGPDIIQIDSLHLVTEGSTAEINGKYKSIESLGSKVDAERVDKNELALFLPSIKLLCSPKLKLNFETASDSVTVQTTLQYNNQTVDADILLNPFNYLEKKTEPVPYFAHLGFNNFVAEDWIELKNKSVLLFGEISIEGFNLLDLQSPTSIIADLHNSAYNEIVFDTLLMKGNYTNDSLSAILNVDTDFGEAELNGNVWNISKTPEYEAHLEAKEFDLTAFIPELERTLLNGTLSVNGKGLDSKYMHTKGNVNLYNSSVYNFPVDTLLSQIHIENSNLNIDSLHLQVPGANATVSGVLNLDSLHLESLIYLDIDSLTVIDSLVVLPIRFDSANSVTTITGPVSELNISGDVNVFNVEGYSTKLGETVANYLVTVKKDSVEVVVEARSGKVEMAGTEWDSLKVELGMIRNELVVDANVVWNDTIDAKVNATIKTGDTMSVVVPNLKFETLLSDFYLADTLTLTMLKKENLEIRNLTIKDQNQPDFIVSANGSISTSDNNFELLIKQLNLNQLNRFVQSPDSIKGIVDVEVMLSGTAGNPEIDGTINIENPAYGSYGLSSLNTNFSYLNQKGFAEVKIPDLGDAFYTSISVPFEAYFDSIQFVFSEPDTFNANLVLDSLPVLKSMDELIPNDSLNGVVYANIQANGEFRNPLFNGNLDLIDGHFVNNRLGLNYDQIRTSLVFEGKKIKLDTIFVKQEEGLITVTGEVEFDSTIVKGNIISSSLQADANNFFVTKHRNYEILIDANTFLETGEQNPEFGGTIKVLKSAVFLPALMPDKKTDIENDIPMLMEALIPENDSLNVENISNIQNEGDSDREAALLNNLTGRLNVEIPRNTWIKSDEMRLEISGKVDIVKTTYFFELFGYIDIDRGNYILYGKKLNIKDSQIIFQGGEELDPNLNFNAQYIFRGSGKQKQYLDLNVTGKLSEPEITFLLDGIEITETDGISILIFGTTSDEIGYSGQNGILSSIGSNAVASVITQQLGKTIGTQLNLDMIEVTATENWQSAAFVVGKYITNDIFVIYQRSFGEEQGDEITPETLTVEYELNEKFFLRIQSGNSRTSGVDVILKFEQGMKDRKSRQNKNASK